MYHIKLMISPIYTLFDTLESFGKNNISIAFRLPEHQVFEVLFGEIEVMIEVFEKEGSHFFLQTVKILKSHFVLSDSIM